MGTLGAAACGKIQAGSVHKVAPIIKQDSDIQCHPAWHFKELKVEAELS